ncbi:hypothetical protein Ddye_013924 [Dipteronia dyeriana]|uniref:Reverse transcriptase zinc-binding domain-containing protein n=1 Tax=Dipteronia dyeriana TaxID=168575 RepID=A0AAD9X7W5_9ROSI|nr:hypothetical protein Ddye_013924 [Dipteronia dyeriana]
MNKALLAKWIWRFGKDNKELWRRVICSNYGLNECSLFWPEQMSNNASYFVKSVGSLLKDGSHTARVIRNSFSAIIGCGDRVQFWNEVKIEGKPLREVFPRVFVLALKKLGTVKDFGVWADSKWVWHIPTRRPLFDWEQDQWRVFTTFLNCITI